MPFKLLALFLLLFSASSVWSVLVNRGSNPLLEVYTLLSALFFLTLPFILVSYYHPHHYSHCGFTKFEKVLTICALVWNGFSFFVFFWSASDFEPLSSYGAFSIFFLIVFSSPLLALIFVCI